MAELRHQDWKVLTIHTPNKALTTAGEVDVTKFRKQGLSHFSSMIALDNAQGDEGRATVSLSMAQAVQKARLGKGMTQKQLAKAINEKPANVVNYESGTLKIPNASAGRIEQALGVKLRGRKVKGGQAAPPKPVGTKPKSVGSRVKGSKKSEDCLFRRQRV